MRVRHFLKTLGIALVSLMVAGCARDLPRQSPVLDAPSISAYHLDTGDRLRIVVFEQDSLSGTYEVDAGGSIMMPLVGQLNARGRTTSGLSSSIKTKLANGFLRAPDVSVELAQTRPFYIHGEVTRPGAYNFVPGMTLERAIALAGGFTSRADSKSFAVDRRNGSPSFEPVNYRLRLLDAVMPGDTIYVRERLF